MIMSMNRPGGYLPNGLDTSVPGGGVKANMLGAMGARLGFE